MGRYDLGLTSEEFYTLQPRQLDALIKRHEREKQETEFLSAQIASCIVNFSMAHPKKPLQPRDFMPSEWAKRKPTEDKPKRRARQMIATEVRATMENWLRKQRG